MSGRIAIRDLRKNFGGTQIIRGLDLEVTPGERHAIIGPNGAGKSTLFHLITGLLQPTSGSIQLNGEEISGLPPHRINRKGLCRSFQITSIFPRMTVFENLRISALARHGDRFGLFRLAARARAVNRDTEELLALSRLEAVQDRLAGDLTYSEQRALEIAMALGPVGDVILLDEPTAGMSNDESMYIVELVRRVTQGKTLIVIEHDMDVVFSLADRISVLVYGQIVASGKPQAIRDNPAVQEAYLGQEHR